MAAQGAGALACLTFALALALALALPIPPGVNAQWALGEEGPDAAGSAADANAYIELLKSDAAYQGMDPEQREAYLAAASEFITSEGAYEAARNRLLVELSEITLQIQATGDERRLAELEARYDDVLKELEEYGVGPQNETEANPGYYFDKYEQALERLEGDGSAGTEEGAAPAPGAGAAGYFRAFLDGLARLYDSLRGIILDIF